MKNTFGLERVRVYKEEKDIQGRVSKEKIGMIGLLSNEDLSQVIELEDDIVVEYIDDYTRKLKFPYSDREDGFISEEIQTLDENGNVISTELYDKVTNENIYSNKLIRKDNCIFRINKDESISKIEKHVNIFDDLVMKLYMTNHNNNISVRTEYISKYFSIIIYSNNNSINSVNFKYTIPDVIDISIKHNSIVIQYIKDEQYTYKLYFDIEQFINYIFKYTDQIETYPSVKSLLNIYNKEMCKFELSKNKLNTDHRNQFSKPKSKSHFTRNNIECNLAYDLNYLMIYQSNMKINIKDLDIYLVGTKIIVEDKENNKRYSLLAKYFKERTLKLVKEITSNLIVK